MTHERRTPTAFLAPLARTSFLVLVVGFSNQVASAQSGTVIPQPSPSPNKSSSEKSNQSQQAARDPVENADEFKSKLTFATYFTPGGRAAISRIGASCAGRVDRPCRGRIGKGFQKCGQQSARWSHSHSWPPWHRAARIRTTAWVQRHRQRTGRLVLRTIRRTAKA